MDKHTRKAYRAVKLDGYSTTAPEIIDVELQADSVYRSEPPEEEPDISWRYIGNYWGLRYVGHAGLGIFHVTGC